MTTFRDKEVYFCTYCPECKYEKCDENDPKSPCYDCLVESVNEYSHVPIYFKKKVANKENHRQ